MPKVGERVILIDPHIWRGFKGVYVRDVLYCGEHKPLVKLDVGPQVLVFRSREFKKDKSPG